MVHRQQQWQQQILCELDQFIILEVKNRSMNGCLNYVPGKRYLLHLDLPSQAFKLFIKYWEEAFDGKPRQNHQLLLHMATGAEAVKH